MILLEFSVFNNINLFFTIIKYIIRFIDFYCLNINFLKPQQNLFSMKFPRKLSNIVLYNQDKPLHTVLENI